MCLAEKIALTLLLLRVCSCDRDPLAERTSDEAGWDAIRELHKQMDDDHSGTVTLEESIEFVQEEMEITDKERLNRRQKTFHPHNDNYITVEDLWKRWSEAAERNWTIDETVRWLEDVVELPQYVESFHTNVVDGRTLPRIASPNASFLVNVLGVTNLVHRRKLQLKAMDVVLFGYKHPLISSFVKDMLLVLCVVLVLTAVAFIRWQKTKAQHDLSQLSSQMAQLTAIETDFNDIQTKLDEERKKKRELSQMATAQESENKKQMVNLLKQLKEADKKITEGAVGLAPLALQPLLKRTYDLEMSRLNEMRLAALEEMKEAMLMVEKLKRKQSSMMTSIRFAVGSDTETMQLDERITTIKSKMDHSARDLEEIQQRWTQIESLCGFSILGSSGLERVRSRVYKGIGHIPLALSSAFMAVPSAYAAIKPSTSKAQHNAQGGHHAGDYYRLSSTLEEANSPPSSVTVGYNMHSMGLSPPFQVQRSATAGNFKLLQQQQTTATSQESANKSEEHQRPTFNLDHQSVKSGSVENLPELRKRPLLSDLTNQTNNSQDSSHVSTPSSSENGSKKVKLPWFKKSKEKK